MPSKMRRTPNHPPIQSFGSSRAWRNRWFTDDPRCFSGFARQTGVALYGCPCPQTFCGKFFHPFPQSLPAYVGTPFGAPKIDRFPSKHRFPGGSHYKTLLIWAQKISVIDPWQSTMKYLNSHRLALGPPLVDLRLPRCEPLIWQVLFWARNRVLIRNPTGGTIHGSNWFMATARWYVPRSPSLYRCSSTRSAARHPATCVDMLWWSSIHQGKQSLEMRCAGFEVHKPSIHRPFTISSPSVHQQFTIKSPSIQQQFTINSPSQH